MRGKAEDWGTYKKLMWKSPMTADTIGAPKQSRTRWFIAMATFLKRTLSDPVADR